MKLQVVWKRGPQLDKSQEVELNEFEPDHDMKDIFTKVSSFYTRDTVTWEPKMCNIMVYRNDSDESIMLAD